MRAAEGRAPAPPPPAADVGVVTALPMEAGHLIDKLSRVRRIASRGLTVAEGELEGRVVAVVSSGVGEAAARRGVAHLRAGHRPRVLVSAGFAGALDPALERNDLTAPAGVCWRGETRALETGLAGSVPSVKVVGTLLMVDRVVTSLREKAELRERTGADLIDMETFAAAAAASEPGAAAPTRFVSLRVVSDDARTELPAEVGRLLNTSGSYRVGAAIRALWGRPGAVKDFWKLHAHAMEAADRLADGLHVLIRNLD